MAASSTYQVRYNSRDGVRFRGGNREFFYSRAHECILSGPAETGKTFAGCVKIHLLAMKYPGCQGAIVRKTQKSVYGSVLQTFDRVTRGAPIVPYGGQRPDAYNYANGSTIWVGGMDVSDKVLSSERDFIYVNQAEELTLNDWEMLVTRTTGRGAVMPYTLLIGDCNPAGSKHWIKERAKDGALTLIASRHMDNPTLYSDDGQLTPQGVTTMGILDKLTGIRRKRLLDGIWATAEGAVYDTFDALVHVRERPDSDFKRWIIAVDEGYTNPAVLLLLGVDGDGRVHIAREFYKRGVLQGEIVKLMVDWHAEREIEKNVVDNAAAGLIADIRNAGLFVTGEKGRVLDGIRAVQDYLAVAGDGRPRLTVDPSCIETINEFESYKWKPGRDEPEKEFDHAMDALRYGIVNIGAGWWVA